MGIKTGMVAMGAYTGSLSTRVAILAALVGDPDFTFGTRSDGRDGGSNLDEMSPVARAQLSVELDALLAAGEIGGKDTAYGSYTVLAADVAAAAAVIDTGIADITLASGSVSIKRAGADVTADAGITEAPAGSIRVVSGGATYVLTAGDVINWLAVAA